MQLVEAGRNEPCPCGSGRKYKKCCWVARDTIVAGSASDPDIAALVDRAIEDDDWDAVHEVFEQGFELFEPAAPLEHVRFRDDLISSNRPEPSELSRLCGGGWLRRCEQEICYVLERYDLEQGERHGLRLAVHLLRRFGAQSPVVESVAELQAAERRIRARKLGDTLSRLGLTVDGVGEGWVDLFEWIEQKRPEVLLFADWFALRVTPEDQVEALWLSGIAMRVCDTCLSLLEQPDLLDARERVQLAALALLGRVPRIGIALARLTSPRVTTDDERMVHAAITTRDPHERLQGAIARIAEATEARGDFAGAALLREAQQRVQARQR